MRESNRNNKNKVKPKEIRKMKNTKEPHAIEPGNGSTLITLNLAKPTHATCF